MGWTVQVEYHGFGLTVPPERLTAPTLSAALQRVLQEPHFKVSFTLPQRKTRKEKTTPFGVNLTRSQVIYQAAQKEGG